MPVPQFLLDLLQLLFDLAVPAAFCTLAAAGVSLRQEGGINFHINGRAGKWILWTVVLLTIPQLLSWIAAQGIHVPSASGSVGTSWLASMETVFKNFVNQIVVARFVPVIAAYFVLKGNARCSRWRESALIDSCRALSDVDLGDDAVASRLELRRRICDDRHARFSLELHRRSDYAGSGGVGLCGRGHQLCTA